MASGVKVSISSAGAAAVLKSAGVRRDVERRAEAVRDSANSKVSPDGMDAEPFGCSVSEHSDRVVAYVRTQTPHGRRHQAKNDTLLRSLDAGR